jgi:hypothetical protein
VYLGGYYYGQLTLDIIEKLKQQVQESKLELIKTRWELESIFSSSTMLLQMVTWVFKCNSNSSFLNVGVSLN